MLAPTGAALAQSGKTITEVEKKTKKPEDVKTFNYADGVVDGRLRAEEKNPSKMAAGIVTGTLTGLLGTGVGYLIVGPEEVPQRMLLEASKKGTDYQKGFIDAWNEKTRKKKRKSFATGGLVGTGLFVIMYIAIVHDKNN